MLLCSTHSVTLHSL